MHCWEYGACNSVEPFYIYKNNQYTVYAIIFAYSYFRGFGQVR